MKNIDVIWEIIKKYEGEVFYTVKGFEFTYEILKNSIKVQRKENNGKKIITKDNFEKALSYQRYDCEEFRNNVWGHSYVRGILIDPRIK